MDFIKKIFRDKIISNIALLLFGLVLVIFPIESISIATEIIAGILIISGLANIIYFFIDKDIKSRMDTMYFLLSLLAIGIGIYTFIHPTWLVAAINIFVGIILIISAINNLRYLFKYSIRNYLWWVFTIISFIILVLGVVAIINPVKVASIITRFEGISLIFDAVMSLFIMKKFASSVIIRA